MEYSLYRAGQCNQRHCDRRTDEQIYSAPLPAVRAR